MTSEQTLEPAVRAPAPVDKGVKYDTDKPRLDLVPTEAILEVAQVFTYGAGKYGAYNWAKGMAWSRLYAATQRHLAAWHQGETFDSDPKDKPTRHLAHAACCIFMLLMHEIYNLGTDDRPKYGTEKKK